MQYRVPKKPHSTLLCVFAAMAGGGALLCLLLMRVGIGAVNLCGALLFFVIASALVARYLLFDCALRLSERYGDFSLSFYTLTKNESHFADKIEFCGKETLLLLNRKGRKTVRKLKKHKDFCSNLLPDKRYALLFEKDGKTLYTVFETSPAFAKEIQAQIDLAKTYYTVE